MSRLGTAMAVAGIELFLSLGVASAQETGSERLTLDDVLGLSVKSSPVASLSGQTIAWVVEERGRRNVWVASPPSAARQLTSFEEDDGMLISRLTFSPDGAWVVFQRGGRVNSKGEVYNPRQLPDPAENALWRVPARGGMAEPFERGNVGSVAFGSDGRLFFARGAEVWERSFPEGEAKRLFTIRGSASSLAPSPDGGKLAFVSNRSHYGRGTYSFVGVFDLADRSVRYVFPNVEMDREPRWSPDGSRIAFVRVPVEPKSYRFTDYRNAVPWSIVVGDPETGEGEVIWTADEGDGSAFHGTRGGSLHWVSGRLVFPWEKTGWSLLYSIPARGGEPRLLTPGEHEVSSVAVDASRGEVVYSSNFGDVERWHLFRVSAEGGAPTQLTSGASVEQDFSLLPNGDVVFREEHSDAPSRIVVLGSAGERTTVSPPPSAATEAVFARFEAPEVVSFAAPDGLRIYAHLYRPPGRLRSSAQPAFVYAHGGCHSKSDPVFRSHFREGLFQYLVSRGYFVLVVNFRSGTGRGLAFREPPRYGGRGAEEIQDLVGAASYLASIPEVDTSAIAIGGWSCGGHMVTNALARHSALYAAGVSYAGVGDWRVEMEMDSGDVLPFRISRRMQLEDLAFESSGVSHMDTWTSPVLFVHGDNDLQAAMWPTIEMTHLLRRKGVPAETLIFPGEDHGFFLQENRVRMLSRVWEFLERHLGQGAVSDERSAR